MLDLNKFNQTAGNFISKAVGPVSSPIQTPANVSAGKTAIANTAPGSLSINKTPVAQNTGTSMYKGAGTSGLINGLTTQEISRIENQVRSSMQPVGGEVAGETKTVEPMPQIQTNTGFGGATNNPIIVNPKTESGSIPSTHLGSMTYNDIFGNRNRLEQIQRKIFENTLYSPEELQARKDLGNISTEELGAANDRNNELERLATSSYLTKGQASGFLSETNRRAQSLLADLAVRKMAASNTLGVYEDSRKNMLDAFGALGDMNKPVAVGGNLINPNTGEVIFKESEKNDVLTVDEAKKLGVPFGTTKAQAYGAMVANDDELLSVEEAKKLGVPYGTTKSQAFGKSASEEDELLSVADAQALGVPYGTTRSQANGISPSSVKALSGEASKLLSITETVQPEIERLKEAFRTNYRSSLVGITTGTNRELVKLVDQVADKVGRLRSGGAINADEAARFKKQIASFADIAFGKPDQAIAALDGILSEAKSVAESLRGSAGSQGPSGAGAIVQTKAGAINTNW